MDHSILHGLVLLPAYGRPMIRRTAPTLKAWKVREADKPGFLGNCLWVSRRCQEDLDAERAKHSNDLERMGKSVKEELEKSMLLVARTFWAPKGRGLPANVAERKGKKKKVKGADTDTTRTREKASRRRVREAGSEAERRTLKSARRRAYRQRRRARLAELVGKVTGRVPPTKLGPRRP